jgi:hypothetical protein
MTGPSALGPPADGHRVPVNPGDRPLAARAAALDGGHAHRAGHLTDSPLLHSQVTGRMYLSEVLAVAALAAVMVTVGAVARWATAGSTVTVWVSQAGDLADPPMRQPEIAGRTELAQGLAAAGFAVVLAAIGELARKSLDRRAAA